MHKIGDQNRFAKDRIISASPEVIPAGIFEFTECQGGLIVHEPHSMIAVFGFEIKVQLDDFIKADAVNSRSSHTDFSTIGRMQDAIRLIYTISVYEGPFFFFTKAASKFIGEIGFNIKRRILQKIVLKQGDSCTRYCLNNCSASGIGLFSGIQSAAVQASLAMIDPPLVVAFIVVAILRKMFSFESAARKRLVDSFGGKKYAPV